MRCVIFDPEDMEALTVIQVPDQYLRGIRQMLFPEVLRFPVYRDFDPTWKPMDDPVWEDSGEWIADIKFEKMARYQHGKRVTTWIGIALNPTTALQLRSDFLPGQRRELQRHEDAAFTKGIAAAFGAFGIGD